MSISEPLKSQLDSERANPIFLTLLSSEQYLQSISGIQQERVPLHLLDSYKQSLKETRNWLLEHWQELNPDDPGLIPASRKAMRDFISECKQMTVPPPTASPAFTKKLNEIAGELKILRAEMEHAQKNRKPTAAQKRGGRNSCRLSSAHKGLVTKAARAFYRRQRPHRNQTEAAQDTKVHLMKLYQETRIEDYKNFANYSDKRVIQLCERKKRK